MSLLIPIITPILNNTGNVFFGVGCFLFTSKIGGQQLSIILLKREHKPLKMGGCTPQAKIFPPNSD
jgi:hypothetical protein